MDFSHQNAEGMCCSKLFYIKHIDFDRYFIDKIVQGLLMAGAGYEQGFSTLFRYIPGMEVGQTR